MPELASHCPATKAADILGDKWVLQILRAMTLGASRYSDFTAEMPRILPSVLSARLKKLTDTANWWFPISPVVLAKQAGELGGATAGAA